MQLLSVYIGQQREKPGAAHLSGGGEGPDGDLRKWSRAEEIGGGVTPKVFPPAPGVHILSFSPPLSLLYSPELTPSVSLAPATRRKPWAAVPEAGGLPSSKP